MVKQAADHCGKKTVYTCKGLQGPEGPPGGLKDYTIVHPRTALTQNEIQGVSANGYSDIFPFEIDRMGFLEAIEISVDTAPAGSVGFQFKSFNGLGTPTGDTGLITISAGNSSAFVTQFGFSWGTLAVGQHQVILKFVADPVTGLADRLLTVYLNIT